MIYWMLNNAWPSLHWNLFDYYLHPGGSYFGTQSALGNLESAIFDYHSKDVYIVNRNQPFNYKNSTRILDISIISPSGAIIAEGKSNAHTAPNTSKRLTHIDVDTITDVVFLRLILRSSEDDSSILSRSVYWLAPSPDTLDWDNSTWYHTPVRSFSNLTSLSTMEEATIVVRGKGTSIQIENTSDVPAVFVRLNLVDVEGRDVVPVMWETNYVTLWPKESYDIAVSAGSGLAIDELRVQVDGRNVRKRTVRLNGGTQLLEDDYGSLCVVTT